MMKLFNILFILIFCKLVSSTYYSPQDKCKLYKNAKFLWWGTDCGKFCHQTGKRVTCMWYQYHQGCFCRAGFFRNRNWDCVPLQGCDSESGSYVTRPKPQPIVVMPAECPANEVWIDCGNRCLNLCEGINNPKKCKNKSRKCDKGCFCKPGMLRNYNGACIRKDQCTLMMGSGSYKYQYSMSISLSLWMKQYYSKGQHCTKRKCQYEAIPNNKRCRANEEFTTCGDKCTEQCRNLYMTDNCPVSCQAGCFCKVEHYRNNRGVCVPAQRCPGYDKRKWLTSTTTRAPPTRETTTTPPPNRPQATYATTSTTTVKPVRNVSDSECPANEIWSNCDSHCLELCENAHMMAQRSIRAPRPVKPVCSANMICMEGCFCKPGFFRDRTDTCVPQRMCPPPPPPPKPPIKCPVNEQYTKCGSKCSESCTLFNATLETNCPPKCEEGCFCMQGFYRDKHGQCIPQDQCECQIPPEKCRDPNEEYLVCGKNCPQTCDDKSPKCRDACTRGCFCKQGYVYNENGVCTLPKVCGQDIRNGTKEGRRKIIKPNDKCPAQHEKWSNCGNQCGDYCQPKFDEESCANTCEMGCFCRKGYKRNSAEQCVLIEKCNEKPNCGENEEYSDCGSNCAARCRDIGKNRVCALRCDKGCFCKNGYLRDDEGKCIPRGKCVIDTTPDCGTNEVYKNCSTHCGETCEDLRRPVECPKPEQECDKGCFCIDDYFRDLDAMCGTRLDCNLPAPVTEEPFCEENEFHKECGNRCDESCEDSFKCKQTCETGCFCLDGYQRNKKGVCVPEETCKGPPQCVECTQNQYYSSCGSDCGRYCTDIGKQTFCDKDSNCEVGCFCKWGLYRTYDDQCVTKNECQFFMTSDDDVDYVTTVDPEGIESPGINKVAKPFSMMGDYNPADYEYPGDQHQWFRKQDKRYSRRRPSSLLLYDYDGFDDPAPNAEIIRPKNRDYPLDYQNFGYENYS